MTPTDPRHSEDWFLERISAEEIPAAELLAVLDEMAAAGALAQADARARLLEDACAERGLTDAALAALGARAGWMDGGPDAREAVRKRALELVGTDRDRREFVNHAGFDKPVAAAEAVRRLRLLLSLRSGALCHDRTWGAGVVRRVDALYGRVEIDFERKAGHQMSFAYAAEALSLLSPDHLLARHLTDPESVRRRAAEDPADLVRWALRDFGPLTPDQLKDRLVPRVLPEAGWKPFWEAARKGLKGDPRVAMPARRSEPLSLRAAGDRHGEAWFAAWSAERDLERLLDMAEELAEAKPEGLGERQRAALAERLGFVVKGAAGGRRPELTARAAMAAAALGVTVPELDSAAADDLWDPGVCAAVLRRLPARGVERFLAHLAARDGARLEALLLDRLPTLDIGPLEAAIETLCARGREDDVADLLRALVARQQIGVEALLWIFRHPDRIAAWSLGALPDLVRRALDVAEEDHSGERLKAQKQMKDRFTRPELLRDALAEMTEDQRRDFIGRLRRSPGWPPLDRQAILGLLVRLCPEYEPLVAADAGAPAPSRKMPVTSTRTFRERQAQLRHIVQVEIPKNSREIGVARSYGDLRENFEYKAAKDMQAVLMRRRHELEMQLREVQPSDFRDVPPDRVGPGVGVALRHADGRVEHYHILGAWDRDEALRIISSESQLAQALAGRSAGDRVALPGEAGGDLAVLERIFPLPDDVLAWARHVAEPAAPETSAP